MATRLHKVYVFSVLNYRNELSLVKLDTDSSYLKTFNTFFGSLYWLCRPIGVKTTPAEYRRRNDECLQNLNGIEDIENDTICVGEGNTYKSAVQDHDRSLIVLVTRYRGEKIKLNSKKHWPFANSR